MTPCVRKRGSAGVHCRADHAVLVGPALPHTKVAALLRLQVARMLGTRPAPVEAIACKLGSLAQHGGLPIRPHAGDRAARGTGERAALLSHTVVDQVRAWAALATFRSTIRRGTTLPSFLAGSGLRWSQSAWHTMPSPVVTASWQCALMDEARPDPNALSRTTRCRACSSSACRSSPSRIVDTSCAARSHGSAVLR